MYRTHSLSFPLGGTNQVADAFVRILTRASSGSALWCTREEALWYERRCQEDSCPSGTLAHEQLT